MNLFAIRPLAVYFTEVPIRLMGVDGDEEGLTIHGKVAPDTHSPSTAKSPEPSLFLLCLAWHVRQPAVWYPFFCFGKSVFVAMQRVCLGIDPYATWDFCVLTKCA